MENSAQSLTPSHAPEVTSQRAGATALFDFLISIDATPAGYSVELGPLAQKPLRSERSQALPHDRGIAQLRALTNKHRDHFDGHAEAKALQSFGTELFHAIFSADDEQALRTSLKYAASHDAALRIVLQVDRAFADIPWEYLFDPERGAFLALSHDTTLVRQEPATLANPARRLAGHERLRILSMTATPHGTAQLDAAAEHQQIEHALAPHIAAGHVTLDVVDGATFADLAEALRLVKPHVFHFSGHGDWKCEVDDAAVLFEDAHGFPQPRTGIDIGAVLKQPELQLAIFNCCHSATPSKTDRLAGITPSLVAQGLPAAVGMQFAFDDKAARVFTGPLLRELAAGTPPDLAMTRARLAVFATVPSIDWATPVLTTRVPVDQILPAPRD